MGTVSKPKPLSKMKFHLTVLTLLTCLLFVTLCVYAAFVIAPKRRIAPDVSVYSWAVEYNYFGKNNNISEMDLTNLPSVADVRVKLINQKMMRLSEKLKKHITDKLHNFTKPKTTYRAQIFYYGWYRTIKRDGQWKHWTKEYLTNNQQNAILPFELPQPSNELKSNYYPQLGCYSSTDPSVIDVHMLQIKQTGIGVVILSWTPPGETDSPDETLPLYLDTAAKYDLKIALKIEPYLNRTPCALIPKLKEFINKYGQHKSVHKVLKDGQLLPIFYVHGSYLSPSTEWSKFLGVRGNSSIRGTKYDGIFLGLLRDEKHKFDIIKGHFDGFYTYYAANAYTYGSSWKNWNHLQKYAHHHRLIFVPCVGSGYSESTLPRWNNINSYHRLHGAYYEVAWRSALSIRPDIVAVTSFNAWHEGSQIEPSIPMTSSGVTYIDFEPEGPEFYLQLTEWWVSQYATQGA